MAWLKAIEPDPSQSLGQVSLALLRSPLAGVNPLYINKIEQIHTIMRNCEAIPRNGDLLSRTHLNLPLAAPTRGPIWRSLVCTLPHPMTRRLTACVNQGQGGKTMIIARALAAIHLAGCSCMRGRPGSRWRRSAGAAGARPVAARSIVDRSTLPRLSTSRARRLRLHRPGERGPVFALVRMQLLSVPAALLLVGCEAVNTTLWPENRPDETALTSRSQPSAEVGLAPPVIDREPYVTIRFEQPNVAFAEPLAQAVVAALQRKPEVAFDVHSTIPPAGQKESVENIERVLEVITEAGLPASRIALWSVSATEVSFQEVNIFVR